VNPWHVLYYAALVPAVLAVFFRSPIVRGSRAGSRPTTPASSVRSGAAGVSPAEPRAAQGRCAQATPVERAVSSPGGGCDAPPASRPAAAQDAGEVVLACCPALPHLHELVDGVCCHGYGRLAR
jgi:hypothetical protein